MKLPSNITAELLTRLYSVERKSVLTISREIGKSPTQISRYLKRFKIEARPFSTKGLQTRLGSILSDATKEKIRQAHLGKKLSMEHRQKISDWNKKNGNPFKGRHHSEESKEKQRQKMRGRKLTPEHREKVIKTLILGDVKGEKSHGWKGGITPINARIRASKEVRLWVKAVKERDDYTCQECGLRDLKNHADHIKPFALYPELRTSIENGRTLCVNCHRKTKTYGGKSKRQ